MNRIIGRKKEIEDLENLYKSNRSEFVIVYGRRRIGKTFIVNTTFAERMTFSFTGARNQPQHTQLKHFSEQLKIFTQSKFAPELKNWEDAFNHLKILIDSLPKTERKVIFFDEMPWIDTHKSSFVAALEYFWNSWAAQRTDILFIACGSATSWMVDKLIENQGGLHNRITAQIYLRPFSLCECEQMLHAIGCVWDRYTILQCYMILGGVPFYLSILNSRESLAQNINRLFFEKNALMKNEFEELFNALFNQADNYIEVVSALAQKREGLQRRELIEKTKISGGGLSKILDNLERCDFITSYSKYKSTIRNSFYRISDNYLLFYFKFVRGNNTKDYQYWTNNLSTPAVVAWQGFSFENVCLQHLAQIKKKLGINGIATNSCSWRKLGSTTTKGTQIDLLIDRNDRIINICEMKFSQTPYSITKEYENNLRMKMAYFTEETQTRKTLVLTMITTYGILPGIHSGVVGNEVDMNDLFAE